jgi:cytochrome c oxidase subunit 3
MGDLIPLTRPTKDSGLSTMGVALFLGSWALTFVGLLIAYAVIRTRMPAWPPLGMPALPIALPTASSIVALVSTTGAHLMLSGVREARRGQARLAGALTLLAGVVFLSLQGWTWASMWHDGLRVHVRAEGDPWDRSVSYAGCVYSLTAFHAAHVLVGLAMLGWTLAKLRRGAWSPRAHQPVRFAVWFWHLVSAAWFAVYGALFLVR